MRRERVDQPTRTVLVKDALRREIEAWERERDAETVQSAQSAILSARAETMTRRKAKAQRALEPKPVVEPKPESPRWNS